MTVLLEPFDDEQVSQWLRVWNGTNTAVFAARGPQTAACRQRLVHAEIARQPLLLLMLALHDADGNPLQRLESRLNQAELYERLLAAFARREVRKAGADLPNEKRPTTSAPP
jgi:hypothetical protein